jgi:hypothetical protein
MVKEIKMKSLDEMFKLVKLKQFDNLYFHEVFDKSFPHFLVGNEEYSLIGSIDINGVNFDPIEIVQCNESNMFKDYNTGEFTCLSSHHSLKTLLNSNGLYFKNPIGNTPPIETNEILDELWEKYQNKTFKGYWLSFLRKTNNS